MTSVMNNIILPKFNDTLHMKARLLESLRPLRRRDTLEKRENSRIQLS